MKDYINLKTKVQLGKNSNVRFVQEKDIDNLELVKVNTSQPKQDRIISFLRNVKNPYMFMIDGIKVKFEYSDKGIYINECIENLIRNKII